MGRRESGRGLVCAASIFVLAMSATSQAFVNPDFTPVDLFRQSDQVFLLDFRSVTDTGIATASIQTVLKGSSTNKDISFDVMTCFFENQRNELIAKIKRGLNPAMMFIGKMKVEGITAEFWDNEEVGFLHYGDQHSPRMWVVFFRNNKGVWELEREESFLFGTWMGSTDMLLRAVNYIESDPDPDFPVTSGVEWQDTVRIGKFQAGGTVIRPVGLAGTDKPDVFVANAAGDRVIRFNGKSFDDVTEKLGLQSASAVWAWGDVTGDGKLDLVSWDGTDLSIHVQKADGTFGKGAVGTVAALAGGCASLAVLDLGGRGHGMILAGTRGMPVLLTPAAGGVKAEPLAAGAFPARDLGTGGMCLAADFDGDGILDVVQLFERGGYFYRGTGKGRFAASVETAAAAGPGRNAACLGDFDGDGLPDIVATAEDKCRLWQNQGGGKFADLLELSGAIGYISKLGGVDMGVGDVNNDGLQDIFIAYANRSTQIFFNRGLRSFGYAYELTENELPVPGEESGQQSACSADFNGDGALDLALVLNDGTGWLVTRKPGDRTLGVTVALPPGANGPLKVVAWADRRCLGAWMVNAGDPGALIGARKSGRITIEWTFPDGKTQKKGVVIKTRLLRLVADAVPAPGK